MNVTDGISVLEPAKITLFQTGIGQDYLKLISKFLSLNCNARGVYVSANRSAKDLIESIAKYDFDLATKLKTGQISIVDLISRSIGAQDVAGVVYVSSPSELSATQMAIEGIISKCNVEPRNTWLIIDSLPTLLIFNGSGPLLNFLHFLVGRLRALGYTGVMFAVEGSLNARVFSTVAQLCDKVIK